jgi:hypothetical protein
MFILVMSNERILDLGFGIWDFKFMANLNLKSPDRIGIGKDYS